MGIKYLKQYGRTKINKLDWLLAIAFCFLALGALWMSLGLSIFGKAYDGAKEALLIFVRGLGFINSVEYGPSAIVSTYTTALFYGVLIYVVLGFIFLKTHNRSNRLPGLFATFVGTVTFLIFLAFTFEYLGGSYKGKLSYAWPIILIIIDACLLSFMAFSVYLTFNFNADIELKKKTEEEYTPVEEVQEVREEIIEEEIEEEAPKAAEPLIFEEEEEEALPPLEKDELDPEELEEETDEPTNPFDAMGERRKRIPFENKMKRSKPEVKERYNEIVEALNEYELNDRKSVPGETFSYKKERLIFLTFSGQTFKVYFKLNPDNFIDSTIPIKDARDIKRYEDVPSCLVIKSNLASRRAVILAKKLLEERGIPLK